jgi:hypothetical protein
MAGELQAEIIDRIVQAGRGAGKRKAADGERRDQKQNGPFDDETAPGQESRGDGRPLVGRPILWI